MAESSYRVSEVAAISGVSVRTLHHYDAIGLVCPAERTSAGYRLYSSDDLLRLQQVLLYRELGLPLEKIKAVLSDPNYDAKAALLEQRQLLLARASEVEGMLRAIEAALRTINKESDVSDKDMFEGFEPAKYEAEVKNRWGGTDAYKESARRTKDYSAEDWARIKAETNELMGRVAAAKAAGDKPEGAKAMDLAEEHRLQIDRYYYRCSPQMHRGLGEMYLQDARFSDNLDKYGDGVAAYLSAAIIANAERRLG